MISRYKYTTFQHKIMKSENIFSLISFENEIFYIFAKKLFNKNLTL